MSNFFENIFGENWRTTLWGGIMLFDLAVNQTPTVIDFLPDDIEFWVRGISGLIVIVSGMKFAGEAKDRKNE